jgi:hypothetical protein
MTARGHHQDEEFDDLLVDELIRELQGSRSRPKGAARPENGSSATMTNALMDALVRAMSQASPLERAMLADALAPALAEALAPALAEALAPALATALSTLAASSKRTSDDSGSGESTRRPEKK